MTGKQSRLRAKKFERLEREFSGDLDSDRRRQYKESGSW